MFTVCSVCSTRERRATFYHKAPLLAVGFRSERLPFACALNTLLVIIAVTINLVNYSYTYTATAHNKESVLQEYI